MPDPAPTWQLVGFLERLDDWIERESPGDDLRLVVTAWVLTRYDDPYQGVRRESAFPNLWFGVIPYSGHDSGSVILCAYWIEESTRTVHCDSFIRLSVSL